MAVVPLEGERALGHWSLGDVHFRVEISRGPMTSAPIRFWALTGR
jgi:hypothetical protein